MKIYLSAYGGAQVDRSILKASKDEIACFRLQVLEFSKKYGIEAAVQAFGVSKAAIY